MVPNSPVTTCSDLTPPSNGDVIYNSGTTNNRPVGTVATYSCDIGYTFHEGSTRICQSNGTWSESASITCEGESVYFSHALTLLYALKLTLLLQSSSILSSTVIPPVYLSLSSTNYLSGLPEIPLSSVGEGSGSSFVCHTDSPTCCQQLDSGVEGGVGEWHYPNGSVIGADSEGGLYVVREKMRVNLNYRSGSEQTVTAGIYCCVVPTRMEDLHSCVLLGE